MTSLATRSRMEMNHMNIGHHLSLCLSPHRRGSRSLSTFRSNTVLRRDLRAPAAVSLLIGHIRAALPRICDGFRQWRIGCARIVRSAEVRALRSDPAPRVPAGPWTVPDLSTTEQLAVEYRRWLAEYRETAQSPRDAGGPAARTAVRRGRTDECVEFVPGRTAVRTHEFVGGAAQEDQACLPVGFSCE
jgi:hypothetical protein